MKAALLCTALIDLARRYAPSHRTNSASSMKTLKDAKEKPLRAFVFAANSFYQTPKIMRTSSRVC